MGTSGLSFVFVITLGCLAVPAEQFFLCFLGQLTVNVVKPHILQAAKGGPKASIEEAMLKCKSGTRAGPPQASPEDGLVVVKTSSQAAKGRPKASTNQALPISKSRTQAANAGP